jgi:probable HAF family extracellular repeat protein
MLRSNRCPHRRLLPLFILSIAALSVAAATAARGADHFPARRTIIEAPNGAGTEASDVNNAGIVVGVYNAPDARAFAWTRGTGVVDLEGATSSFSLARAINECGQIVGELGSHAVRWNTFHEIEDLGTLGGLNSSAGDVNDRGDVAGHSQIEPGGRTRPFLWTEEEGMRQIVECEGQSGTAVALNNARQVVGSCDGASGGYRAFFWSAHTGRIDLDLPGFQNSSAVGINDRGEVVGAASTVESQYVAAFKWWPTTGRVVLLRDLGDGFSLASDINQSGLIVGDAIDNTQTRHAVAWLTPRLGGELDPGLGTSSSATALNDLGSVVGTVQFGSPRDLRAVLWEPPKSVSRILSKHGARRCMRPAP